MAIYKTIGGDRLGSGKKLKAALHNYERSTHNKSRGFISSMAPGVLYPCFKELVLNGDTYSINITNLTKTVPAIGPLFGAYKLQIDLFEVPIRLYNGILHNNMTKLGMDADKVKLPKMELSGLEYNTREFEYSNYSTSQISASSIMHYLGIKGIMHYEGAETYAKVSRKFNAVPYLAYYDIFKNYYSNKQEENAYIIGKKDQESGWSQIEEMTVFNNNDSKKLTLNQNYGEVTWNGRNYKLTQFEEFLLDDIYLQPNRVSRLSGYYNGIMAKSIVLQLYDHDRNQYYYIDESLTGILKWETSNGTIDIEFNQREILEELEYQGWAGGKCYYHGIMTLPQIKENTTITIKPFKLSNIDDMRIAILQNTALGTEYMVNTFNKLPYSEAITENTAGFCGAKYPLNGLVLKTYQSDIFNNWLSQDWIDGIKGVNEISAIAVESGKIEVNAINLAQKVYNMLNRVAVSGGTYEDWQEAVYGEDALRRAESPIYCGGYSCKVVFEEVVSTADTETNAAGDMPLGSLAGKGITVDHQGGEIEIHVKEPSYIIGIASLTPYIVYSQGNDFDMTELDSINDIHKPELDEIGFQDLMLERAAWWGTYYDEDQQKVIKQSGGKLPAWIEYMTNVDEVHGDFAENNNLEFMVLNRNYEFGWQRYNENRLNEEGIAKQILVKDWTTYINPTKYNYQFANNKIDAQNFWVQIKFDVTARRKMSAKLIPNL